MGKLIINGNQIYEIDEECIRRREREEKKEQFDKEIAEKKKYEKELRWKEKQTKKLSE